MALAMSLGVFQQSLASSAPKHRYTPSAQQVDKKWEIILKMMRE